MTTALPRTRPNRSQQEHTVRAATLALLNEVGYERLTMGAIATRARMSKETLYKLYPSKEALLVNLIEGKSVHTNSALTLSLNDETLAIDAALCQVGEALLGLLSSEESVTVNRVAIASVAKDSAMAQLLFDHGRQVYLPQVARLINRAVTRQELRIETPADGAELFVGLLLGDLQLRRLLGVSGPPDLKTISTRTAKAVAYFMRLFAVENNHS